MFCLASQSVISASSSGRIGALVAWAKVNKAPSKRHGIDVGGETVRMFVVSSYETNPGRLASSDFEV